VIETERLLLRPITMEDLDPLVAMYDDPEVARFMGSFSPEQAVERLKKDQRDWLKRGHGLLTILDRATGEVLGRTGLRYWPQFDETEVGWLLRRDAWGRGLATEAACASAAWGFRQFGFPYLTAMIDPRNTRSISVAERLGMTPLRDDILLGAAVTVFAVGREDWRGAPTA
jgi:RimJ/RimL family protein N-acetyltransferase